MTKYVYFYRVVGYGTGGTQNAKHGVVKLNDKIDSAEKYLNFCDAIATVFSTEDKKSGCHTKDVDVITLQLLHEVNE